MKKVGYQVERQICSKDQERNASGEQKDWIQKSKRFEGKYTEKKEEIDVEVQSMKIIQSKCQKLKIAKQKGKPIKRMTNQ